jgi:hypothetical protein
VNAGENRIRARRPDRTRPGAHDLGKGKFDQKAVIDIENLELESEWIDTLAHHLGDHFDGSGTRFKISGFDVRHFGADIVDFTFAGRNQVEKEAGQLVLL